MNPADLKFDLTWRIRNWARWAREHSGSIGHCMSIEHRYRSPQCWWPEEARVEVDLADAMAVERAVRAIPIEFQKPYVWFVVYFGQKREAGQIPMELKNILVRILARRYKLVINRNRIADVILDAQHMVENRLTTPKSGSRIPRTIQV